MLLTVLSIFSRGLTSISIGGTLDFDVFAYLTFILVFVVLIIDQKISSKAFFILLLIFVLSLSANAFSGYSFISYLKYFAPIVLIYLSLYSLFFFFPLKEIFEFYVEVTLWTAYFGLIQLFVKLFLGIQLLSGYESLDIHSVALEPSHYVVIMMPATVYALLNYSRYGYKAIVLLLTLVGTFKITAFFALFVLLVLINYRSLNFIFVLLFSTLIYLNFIITREDYAIRLVPMINYFFYGKLPPSYQLHGTPLSFISNLEVAFYSLKKNFLLGVGFGGHRYAYDELFSQRSFIGVRYLFGLNKESAHSLIIRILSETGILGFSAYIFTLWKGLILNTRPEFHMQRAISLACLSHFIGKALKLGSYIDYGTPFFFCILILNFLDYKRMKDVSLGLRI